VGERFVDAYAVARYVRHYGAKNGYAPRVADLPDCTAEDVGLLVKNGIVTVETIYDGGPPVAVVLTDKGRRMADERRRR
jgi:hypothetical protein